jgi:hypothetical protein
MGGRALPEKQQGVDCGETQAENPVQGAFSSNPWLHDSGQSNNSVTSAVHA